MIKIKYQCAYHQYDEDYNIITDWDTECDQWVVRREYSNEYIDWNGFAQGVFLK